MSSFFPRHTATYKVEEPAAFRKLTLSVVEMGIITGIVLRLYRSLALTHGSDSWLYLGGAFALGAIFLFGMTTLHLGNYTVRRWVLRAPVFALIAMAAEMATSAILIALHREPLGSGRAEFGDWLSMALDLVLWRFVPIVLFALVLAGVVQLMRYLLLKHEDRDHTVTAIHESQGPG